MSLEHDICSLGLMGSRVCVCVCVGRVTFIVHWESIDSTSLVPHFFTLQPYSKIDWLNSFFISKLHTIQNNDKGKRFALHSCTFIKNKKHKILILMTKIYNTFLVSSFTLESLNDTCVNMIKPSLMTALMHCSKPHPMWN